MTILERVHALLPEMTSGEKTQLLQWIARDLSDTFPGIESTLGPNLQLQPQPGVMYASSTN